MRAKGVRLGFGLRSTAFVGKACATVPDELRDRSDKALRAANELAGMGMMSDNSEAARARAEARFEKLQKTTAENAAVWAQYEASRDAMRDRTANLKEMRLAKEAAEAETAAAAAAEKAALAAAKKKRKTSVKA